MGWLSQLEISPTVREHGEELHRRRVLAGSLLPLETSVAEVAVLDAYGQFVSIDHLVAKKNALQLIPEDTAGQRLRIVVWRTFPLLVYSRFLDVDAYIFAVPQPNTLNVLNVAGWLPLEQVEEAPVVWFIQDGERKDYSHEVSAKFMAEMPGDFLFRDPCKHFENYGAIWDYNHEGWECCGCGRWIYDAKTREAVQRDRARRDDSSRLSDQVLP